MLFWCGYNGDGYSGDGSQKNRKERMFFFILQTSVLYGIIWYERGDFVPRKAREKNEYAVYHIVCRSISEILLFREDSDKDYYLSLLKKYLEKYRCAIYAFCLMTNHLHLHLDPKGYDISKLMHGINSSYVRYYNKKYNRHGHVFQERFFSRILGSDANNIVTSAYIHNNPSDIAGYDGREEYYKYSSFGIYLGLLPDLYHIIDKSFIQSLFHARPESFTKAYFSYVKKQELKEPIRPSDLYNDPKAEFEYVSGRKVLHRNIAVTGIISYVSKKFLLSSPFDLALSANRKVIHHRAFVAYVLRVLCGFGYRQICETMLNITVSACARLCDIGFSLASNDKMYMDCFTDLLSYSI